MSSPEGEWQPKMELLEVLLSMDIPHHSAVEALLCTGNTSAEDALNFIFNTEEKEQSLEQQKHLDKLIANKAASDEDEAEDDHVYHKMTFVVNTSLKMGVGKVAAQVGHACLGLYRDMQKNNLGDVLTTWEYVGEKKIVLKGSDHLHLQELYEKAKAASIPAYLVRDAGHTQIAPGSVTVLSLFGLEDEVDKITGKLSLL